MTMPAVQVMPTKFLPVEANKPFYKAALKLGTARAIAE